MALSSLTGLNDDGNRRPTDESVGYFRASPLGLAEKLEGGRKLVIFDHISGLFNRLPVGDLNR